MRTRLGKIALAGLLLLSVVGLAHPVLASPFAYITNSGSNTVSVMDLATNTVAGTIPVGSNPQGVAVSPAGTQVYVCNYGTNDISIIDTVSGAVVATLPLSLSPPDEKSRPGDAPSPQDPPLPPRGPLGIAFNPSGTRVYVADNISGHMTIIDATTQTVVGSVISGSYPYGVAVNPSGNLVYVTNSGENTVSVIDTATQALLKKVEVGSRPFGIAVNPDGTRVYVANNGSSAKSTVSVIDTATNTVITNIEVAHISVGSGPHAVVVNPAGTRVYVTNDTTGYVAVIDAVTSTVTDILVTGSQQIGLSLNAEGTRLYVAVQGTGSVSVIDTDTKTILTSVPVGTAPYAFGQFVAQGTLWGASLSFSIKFTYLGEDRQGNMKFQTLTQTFTGKIRFFENERIPKQITFVSDDGKTTGYFRNLASIQTDTSGKSESLLFMGLGDFASSLTGVQTTGIAYIDAKGTLKEDSTFALTSMTLSGKIAGGVDQATTFSGTFRATLTK